jgi:hypothetical protein
VANTTTAVLAGVNANSSMCQPSTSFIGARFIAAYCSGAGTTLTNAGLYVVEDVASPTATTLIDPGAATSIKPFFASDKAGDHLFVLRNTTSRGQVVTVAGVVVADIEDNVGSGVLSDDGMKVYYRTSALAYRVAATTNNGTPASAPAGAVTLVANGGYPGTIDVAPDRGHTLFRKLTPVGGQNEATRVDINLIDTVTPGQSGTALVPTATGIPVGFTATSTHVLYVTAASAQGLGDLKSRTIAGGDVRDVASGVAQATPLNTGTKALFWNNLQPSGQSAVGDLSVFDAANANAPTRIAQLVDPSWDFSGTKIVYSRQGATGGVYVADIP